MIDQYFITSDATHQAETQSGVFQRKMAGTTTLKSYEVFIERDTIMTESQQIGDQVSYVVYGELIVTVAGEAHTCKVGDSYAVANGAMFEVRALRDSLVVVAQMIPPA